MSKRISIKTSVLILTIVMIISNFSGSVMADGGWKRDSSGWWYSTGNSYYKSQWALIDGNWYYFNSDGYMESDCYRDGCWLESNGAWNKSYSHGTWKCNSSGWWYEDNGWYPVNKWLWIDGNQYYFNDQGYMEHDCYRDGCWLTKSGAKDPDYCNGTWKQNFIGWWYEDNGWYPKDKNVVIDGVEYHFGSLGYWEPVETVTDGFGTEIDVTYKILGSCDGIVFVQAYSNAKRYLHEYTDLYDVTCIGNENTYTSLEYMLYVTAEVDTSKLYIKYNGDEGYRDLGDGFAQSIPDFSSPLVTAYISYDDSEDFYPCFDMYDNYRADFMAQKGFSKRIYIEIEYCEPEEQSFDLYYKDTKITTFKYKNDQNKGCLDNAAASKSVVEDILKYKADMNDLEMISAACYWYSNHSYYDYTCWACHGVGNIMKLKGYPAIALSCSYYKDGSLYNDYGNYYSVSPKNSDEYSLGHRVCLIFVDPTHYVYVQVQGSLSLAKGETDFSNPWVPNEAYVHSIYDKLGDLRDYETVYDMMLGDFGIDITEFDPYDCSTWY